MSAATAGYRTIGADSRAELTIPASPPRSAAPSAGERMHAMARSATAAASGAAGAVSALVQAPAPELNLYTEPLDPSATLSARDRAQLVLESCRPWGEFADAGAFGLPVATEVKLRVGHNVEIFFYNYLVLGMLILALHAVFRPLGALLLGTTVVGAFVLYILHPENYVVSESFSITMPLKHAIMGVVTVLVLTVGHVFSLLFAVALTVAPVVLVHAFLREHDASAV